MGFRLYWGSDRNMRRRKRHKMPDFYYQITIHEFTKSNIPAPLKLRPRPVASGVRTVRRNAPFCSSALFCLTFFMTQPPFAFCYRPIVKTLEVIAFGLHDDEGFDSPRRDNEIKKARHVLPLSWTACATFPSLWPFWQCTSFCHAWMV